MVDDRAVEFLAGAAALAGTGNTARSSSRAPSPASTRAGACRGDAALDCPVRHARRALHQEEILVLYGTHHVVRHRGKDGDFRVVRRVPLRVVVPRDDVERRAELEVVEAVVEAHQVRRHRISGLTAFTASRSISMKSTVWRVTKRFQSSTRRARSSRRAAPARGSATSRCRCGSRSRSTRRG